MKLWMHFFIERSTYVEVLALNPLECSKKFGSSVCANIGPTMVLRPPRYHKIGLKMDTAWLTWLKKPQEGLEYVQKVLYRPNWTKKQMHTFARLHTFVRFHSRWLVISDNLWYLSEQRNSSNNAASGNIAQNIPLGQVPTFLLVMLFECSPTVVLILKTPGSRADSIYLSKAFSNLKYLLLNAKMHQSIFNLETDTW